VISSNQIRASRALLGWSGNDLANKSGVGITTLRRYELQDGIPSANTNVLMSIKTTFEASGIEFTGDPLVNPGVMLHLQRDT
jgi:transcriptional regulator with XRE-family HTH domain